MVVDDHPLVRRGLTGLISDDPQLQVCGEAGSAEAAYQTLDECRPDLIVVDISLPGMNGVELIKRIRTRNSLVKILVSSMHDEALFAERCLRAGANGYIDKKAATQQVIEAIHTVLTDGVYLSAEESSRMVKLAVSNDGTRSSLDTLTDRELEVFGLIGRGLRTRDIADRLHLSVKTIETHRDHVRRKLGVGSSTEVMRHAIQWVLEQE